VVVTALALICCLLWGSAYPCIKNGYEIFAIASGDTAAQLLFAGCRFTLAGVLVVLIGSALEGRFLLPRRSSCGMIVKLASVQTVGQYVCFYIGLAHTTGVKSSIICGMTAFLALLIAGALGMEKPSGKKLLGCVLGFVGVVLVNVEGGAHLLQLSFSGEGMVFISTLMYALSSTFMKRYSQREDPVTLSGWQFVLGGAVLIVCGAAMGGRLTQWSFDGGALLTYMAFLSAAAYSLWSILLRYNPVSKVVVFSCMTPVFGVIMSALFLGEAGSIRPVTILALALVCGGIWVVNGRKKETEVNES